jgi:Flp pilus assembly protein TadD
MNFQSITATAIFLFCLCFAGCGTAGTSPVESDRIFSEANQLYFAGKFSEAEEKFQWLIRNNTENPRLYNNIGNLYFNRGETEKAEAQYKKALELNPGYLIARVNLAMLSLKHGEPEDALRLLQDGIKEYPENADLHNGIGIYELRKGKIKEAVNPFRKAIDIQGENPVFYNNLAYAYAESNEYLNEALKLAKKALKGDPQNAVFLDTLGWIYFKKGVFDESIVYLSSALEIAPRTEVIRSHLVTVYRWIGQEQKALHLLKEGIRLRVMSKP